jgi:hypothetical protein
MSNERNVAIKSPDAKAALDRTVMSENKEDLAAFAERAAEPVISYEALLRKLKVDERSS